MKITKAAVLLISFCFTCLLSVAQLIPVKNSFQTDISKVISDYPNHFKSLTGELIIVNPQSSDYHSLLILKDAEECTITKYSATGKEVYSWQAVMLKTESFEEAVKKFKSFYSSLQNLSANVGSAHLVFKGEYENPVEEMKFTSIIFKNSKEEEHPSKLRLELLLENELLEWVVKVLVYDRDREDYERGPVKE